LSVRFITDLQLNRKAASASWASASERIAGAESATPACTALAGGGRTGSGCGCGFGWTGGGWGVGG
jgi:hypothetical protein